mgnify:CR=1 FL=1
MSGITSTIQVSTIKGIQRGTIVLSAATGTATITSVDTTKTELRHLGQAGGAGGEAAGRVLTNIVLTNSTTITATMGIYSATDTVSWELTEYY